MDKEIFSKKSFKYGLIKIKLECRKACTFVQKIRCVGDHKKCKKPMNYKRLFYFLAELMDNWGT